MFINSFFSFRQRELRIIKRITQLRENVLSCISYTGHYGNRYSDLSKIRRSTSSGYTMQKTSAPLGKSFDSPGGCNQYAPGLPVARVDTSRATFQIIRKESHFVCEEVAFSFKRKIIFTATKFVVRYEIVLSLSNNS